MKLLDRLPAPLGRAGYVVIGLGIQAVTAYVTLILSGRILGAALFGGLAALYTLVTSVATGLFQPLEQEVARRRGREWETRIIDGTLLRRAARFGLVLCVLVIAVAIGAHGAAVRLLGGHLQLLAAFCVAMPGYALCFVARGALSGSRRLARYGLQLSVEGTFRLVGLGVLVLVGSRGVAGYGWLFGIAPWVALVVSVAGLRPAPTSHAPDSRAPDSRAPDSRALESVALESVAPESPTAPVTAPGAVVQTPERDPAARSLAGALTLLLVSTLTAQLLIGAGPVIAQYFAGTADKARTGAFLAALVVVRLPVFMFTAVQPSMLPRMAEHVAAGRAAAFRSLLLKVLAAMGLFAAVTTVGTTVLGPWALKLLFGSDYVLSWGEFLLMGVSVGLFMASSVLGQALLAVGKHSRVAAGWLVGLAGLALGTAFAHDAVLRATLGLLIGAAASAATFAALLAYALWRWRPAHQGQQGAGDEPAGTSGDRLPGTADAAVPA
ncbi:lipopolysaccharide biosynthesis protein [Rugosimonospora africana]|uniref:Membrane protein involved in the export of O-antigen and teichoic acid n=1 Tax=Rugosimonospora africana TaxID=556532 RepID=A0A8J3QPF5_9ACTN|nr:hypothetical protein [Rugosimonospora africana]GIH14131.1 hypothetical protein Raf01_23030 [Rugosimonospora africana]